MKRWQKILLGAFGVYTACALVLGLVIGVWVWRAGSTWVALDVPADGLNVRVPVPMAAAEMGLVLARHTSESPRIAAELAEVRHLLPAVTGLAAGLADAPDGVLLRLRDGSDNVQIEKRGARLLVMIESAGERVLIDAPARAPERLLARIGRLTT